MNIDTLKRIKPKYIFFPHWSWIIPKEIYENYECIVFHMADLPYGRGGSPLQNLLVRGIYETKISAIRADAGVDTGDIYIKEPINISDGNADEILKKVSEIVFKEMIPYIVNEKPKLVKQTGEIVEFKRRKKEMSRIPDGLSKRQIYDYIRMLDGEGYPTAYMELAEGKIYCRDARLVNDVLTFNAEYIED